MKGPTKVALAVLLVLSAGTSFAQAPATSDGAQVSKMQETMRQIRRTEDPDERARLLEAHLDEMHAAMSRMHRDLGTLMEGVEQQKRETRRLHDHRRTK